MMRSDKQYAFNLCVLVLMLYVFCHDCFSNCGVQVCKPKSLYTLSHKVVLGSMTGFCHCHVVVASLYKKVKFSFQFQHSPVFFP